jgi:caa(3)-type oxidase subunit IV
MSHDGHHSVVIPAPGPEFVPHTVAHHFDTPVQEFQAAKLGFWLFLATEILLFGGLFAAYFYYHDLYPETFKVGGQQLDWKLGAINTSVLLLSSWTMAMGVRSAQTSQKQKTMVFCALTVVGAAIFMVIKFFEYKAKTEHGLFVFPHMFDGYQVDTTTMTLCTSVNHDRLAALVHRRAQRHGRRERRAAPARPPVLRDLRDDDGHPRPARRHRRRPDPLGHEGRRQGPLPRRLLPARRPRGPVLAPRRPDLDLPLPPAVPGALMSAHAHNDGHGHGELQMGHHHVSSSAMFFNVLVVLLILTVVTVGVSRIDFGPANMLIAMLIASVKASLVILFFMHVKWDTAINKIVFLSSFLFLSLLFVFTLADQATRRIDHPMHVTKAKVSKEWVYPKPATSEKH